MLRQAFPTSEYPNINLIQMDVTKPKDVAKYVWFGDGHDTVMRNGCKKATMMAMVIWSKLIR